MDLTDIYRVFHSAITQYTFFSGHGISSKIELPKQVLTSKRKLK
jgi:hypothetical protein